jgi:hypothetical protein
MARNSLDVNSSTVKGMLVFSKMSRLAVRPTQPPIHLVLERGEANFLGG